MVDVDSIMEKIEHFMDGLGPGDRAQVIAEFREVYGDAADDAVLSLYIEDTNCDFVCEDCEKSDKLDCIREMKELLLYLIGEIGRHKRPLTRSLKA